MTDVWLAYQDNEAYRRDYSRNGDHQELEKHPADVVVFGEKGMRVVVATYRVGMETRQVHVQGDQCQLTQTKQNGIRPVLRTECSISPYRVRAESSQQSAVFAQEQKEKIVIAWRLRK